MRNLAPFVITALLVAATTMPAVAVNAKIGDLSKAGFSCKEVGPDRHVCQRGKQDPTFGCEKGDCTSIRVAPAAPTRVEPKATGGSTVR